MYEYRFYRDMLKGHNLTAFQASYYDSDLQLYADRDLRNEALSALVKARGIVDGYIQRHPDFLTSLQPLPDDEAADPIVREMFRAGLIAAVGPMAAIAGTFAEYVGRALLTHTREVIVENGGDVFMVSHKSRLVSIFAGESPLSLKVGIKIPPSPEGIGVCTSSGTVGPSLSFGKADAAVVIARNTAVADACATAIGNLIDSPENVEAAIERAKELPEIDGVVVVIGETLGAWGQVELQEL